MQRSLNEAGIFVPAEWAPQKAIWTAWPADLEQWDGDLATPRREMAALVRALSASNRVRLLAAGTEAEASARAALGEVAEIVPARYGDIWLRDTGPIFARDDRGPVALRFRTNGWGGKFDLPDDTTVGDEIARAAGTPIRAFNFVLEGGAIENDGEGTILTTRQAVLNANRNGWTEAQAEAALREAIGARKIIWLDRGLRNDHTDGHIDTLARFVGPGRVVCQSPSGANDPNAKILNEIARMLEAATDASGRKLEVIRIPSPGLVHDTLGEPAPASHANFVIANDIVVMPTYGTPSATQAVEALQKAFPSRKVVGLPSRGILGTGMAGGGSFHCITREEPL
ncbi:MAG TPA: agmatine deiminase family protein [Methyloceanibacter sp.]|nr:agmatine deiminase family protein [Methyloceanibacter sp.]